MNIYDAMPNRFGRPERPGRFGVILAGGDGSRLRPLTRIIEGDERPKQFCHILHGKSLLDVTRERTALGIRPEHTYFSLTRKHERYFRASLGDVPSERLHIQPVNKGTAPALYYSLLRLAAVDPSASVAFFPSDHFVSNDEALMAEVEKAFTAVESNSASIILLGIEPDSPETSYGWIEPSDSIFGSISGAFSRVERFWEKPAYRAARKLFRNGGLWNSFVMIGRVDTFISKVEKTLPELIEAFVPFFARGRNASLNNVYANLRETNFSCEVLEKCAKDLHVLRVSDVHWSDLGEPQRVLGTLQTFGVQTEWMAHAV